MSKVLSMAWKDVQLRFASRSELLFFLILPMLFTFLIGQFAGDQAGADQRVVILTVNQDASSLASDLIATLNASTAVRAEVLDSETASDRFQDRDAPALLTIPSGFETALRNGKPVDLALETDPTNMNALVAEQGVVAAAGAVGRPLAAALLSTDEAARLRPFADEAQRAAYFDSSLAAARDLTRAAPQRLEMTTAVETDEFEATFDSYAFASAGQLVVWVFIPLLGTSAMFAYERTIGTLRRLLTTPTRSSTYLLGTISGQLGMGLLQMLILIGFGALVFGVNWGQSPAALAAVMVAFALSAVAMGAMLGAFVKTESQAGGLSIMLGMTLGLLGGCMWPLELFPPAMQKIVHIFPTTWAMEAMTDITMRGAGLADVLPAVGALLAFAVVFFVIGVRRFRYE